IGKKPTTINRNGIMRSPINCAPNPSTNPANCEATNCASAGNTKVSTTIGAMIRQSRKLSRTSRRVTIRALLNVCRNDGGRLSYTNVGWIDSTEVLTSFALLFLVFFDHLQVDFLKRA